MRNGKKRGGGFTQAGDPQRVRAGDKLFTLSEAEVPNSHWTFCGLLPPLSLDAEE